MSENIDYCDTNYDLRSIIEGDRRYYDKEDLSRLRIPEAGIQGRRAR